MMRLLGGGKTEADDLLSLDVYWLNKHGYLRGFKSGGIEWSNGFGKNSIGITASTPDDPYIHLRYTQSDSISGEKKNIQYKVRLTTTPCNFGGVRYWFLCPLFVDGVLCGRRVGTLYKNGDYFGCRHCHDLTYSSKLRSGGLHSLVEFVVLKHKIEQIKKDMKRRYYAGKPTKKQQRLYKLYARTSGVYSKIDLGKLR